MRECGFGVSAGRGLGVSKKNPAESLLSMGEDGYDGLSGILRIYANRE